MKILKEGVNKTTGRILGLEEISVVCTNRLMELACCSGLCVAHSEKGEAYRR